MSELISEYIVPYFKRRELRTELAALLVALMIGSVGSPFAVGAVAACWMLEISPYYALCGAVAGAVVAGHYSGAIACSLFVAIGLVVSVWRRLTITDKLIIMAVAQFLLIPVYCMATPETCITGIAAIALSVVAAATMRRAIQGLRAMLESRLISDTEQLCLTLLAVLMTAAFADVTILGVRVCCVFAALLTLCAVRIKGALAVVAALLLGVGCVLANGATMQFAACIAVCALCAGAFHRSKWALLAVFSAFAALGAFKIGDGALTYIEGGIAAAAYAAVPERLLHRAASSVLTDDKRQSEQVTNYMRGQLKCVAGVLLQLAALQQGCFASQQLGGAAAALNKLSDYDGTRERRRFNVRIGAAACSKGGSPDTGDCMGMRQADGSVLLLLSDGMGSGTEAHKESATAVAMLGDLLTVGFDLSDALECVNRLLMRSVESDMYATLDATIIDLAGGGVRFVKFGAPPSYIMRGKKLHTIYAEALPVGIIESARPAVHEATLNRGDIVVMMTDGVPDALGAELNGVILEKAAEGTEDEAAGAILYAAREKSCADDMSVIIARVL
ncbi:MAG: SpoIIE family protein phosphatase [Clostridia bacterium]